MSVNTTKLTQALIEDLSQDIADAQEALKSTEDFHERELIFGWINQEKVYLSQLKAAIVKTRQFDRSHGSLFDRGESDSYYGRSIDPHWWGCDFGTIRHECNSDLEVAEYMAGFEANEASGVKKYNGSFEA
jgi:hypothetical protein